MGGLVRYRFAALASLLGAGCGFSPAHATRDAGPDSAIDAPADVDAPPQGRGWIVASMANPGRGIVLVPYDASAGLGTPCPLQSTTYAYRALYLHPTLPYFYGVEAALEGFSLSCTNIAGTTLGPLGSARAVQDIVMDPAGQTGFVTLDGSGATAVFRFTTQGDGTPTPMGSANGPTGAGPLALSAADGELFAAGAGVAYGYQLVGNQLDLPATTTNVATCAQPAGLVLSGPYVLAFCSDVPDIKRYTRSPFAYDSSVGSAGTVTQVVSLPGDAAVIARSAPPGLALVALNGGSPTWTDGPQLAGVAIAMAASADGKYLVTARQFSNMSELTLWKIDGPTIAALGTTTIAGSVAALAATSL